MKQISGGVMRRPRASGPRGSTAASRATAAPDKNDLALILSDRECAAAAVYTMNRVKAAPIYVTMDHLENGTAWGIVANSGNANACCPHEPRERRGHVRRRRPGHRPRAGGFRGGLHRRHRPDPQHRGHPGGDAGGGGRPHPGPDGSDAAAHAIMTTDTVKKELAVACSIGGRTVRTGRHRQGLRHDPPQHGHHAVLRHHRLRHHPGDAGRGPPRGGPPHLQPGDGGRGHLHQRHVRGAGQRHGGQSPHRVEG